MPEGDVIWSTARRLHDALAGQVLTRSDFRVPKFATVDLSGQLVTEVVPRGKHLLIRTGDGLTVHSHLKMDGFWRVRAVRPGVRPAESFKLRLLLANSEWEAAGYLLAVTEVIPTADEDRVVGHLGPDLLGPDWDPGRAVGLLSRDPDRSIGEALLDQRNLAGIGNVYLAEMLFLRGLDPSRPVGSIEDLPALVDLGRRLLDANKARPGHVTTGDTRRGRENWVYGRGGKPCRRCGTQIKRAEQGPAGQERLRFWCPSCQL
ncbi:MAG TPA: DNA-formamidopyrimidine glycosylase family protein [Trebonia sp.]|jgi:endonuclease-8|nr:DNA-formamidopyrimidine glycosylase family protein [Trebonia sp.]